MRARRAVHSVACFLVIAATMSPVRAETGCGGNAEHAPVVVVAFSGEPWDGALERGVLEHLRAGLEPAGFRVCEARPGDKTVPVATVELRRSGGERVAATIEVRDGITAKRVARDIDLSALPEDGRALGVGVAADELLRASWIELSLANAPPPARPPPPAVDRAVQASLGRDHLRSEVSVRGSAEGYGGSLLLLGADVAFRHWMTPKVGFEIGVGLRSARPLQSANGEITASAFGVEVAVEGELLRAGNLRVHLETGLWAATLRFKGEPTTGSQGDEGAEVTLVPRAGLGLTYFISSFALSLRGGGAVAARGVTARDHGAAATGATGFGWYASLGPSVVF